MKMKLLKFFALEANLCMAAAWMPRVRASARGFSHLAKSHSNDDKTTRNIRRDVLHGSVAAASSMLFNTNSAVAEGYEPQLSSTEKPRSKRPSGKVAVIGAGWWSQGWHIPQLNRNPDAELVAIAQHSEQPTSKLANLKSRTDLSQEYNVPWYNEITDVFDDPSIGPDLDGVVVTTPHSTHYAIGKTLLEEAHRRRKNREKPLNILMEKPMTANVKEAKKLHDLVTEYHQQGGKGCFLVNHSANYREKAQIAREIVESGKLGRIQHMSAFFASPLMEIFDDPDMKGWNEPSGDMLGNGFAWGQIAHMLGYIFHVCPDLEPQKVFCQMSYDDKTGADIAHAATITCTDCNEQNVILSLSGTALVPGGETEGVGKQARIQIYGRDGALLYAGNDSQYESGHMELRRVSTGGKIEKPAGDGFYFENTKQEGNGPESLQSFIDACNGKEYYDGAGSLLGLKTVEVISAMYRSAKSSKQEDVEYANTGKSSIVDA